jgi:RNA-directed DNA polymerase
MDNIDEVVAAWDRFFRERVKRRTDLTENYVRYVKRLLMAELPAIFELPHLSALMGTDPYMIARFIASPGAFYRSFQISKRSGGFRTIDTPVPELLYAQRWILANILSKVPISDCAHGFVAGRSIITNASVHLGQPMLLKLDLASFSRL